MEEFNSVKNVKPNMLKFVNVLLLRFVLLNFSFLRQNILSLYKTKLTDHAATVVIVQTGLEMRKLWLGSSFIA